MCIRDRRRADGDARRAARWAPPTAEPHIGAPKRRTVAAGKTVVKPLWLAGNRRRANGASGRR
eukprot:5877537-Prymnesium_polylepis.1